MSNAPFPRVTRVVCGALLALAVGDCNCNGNLATSPGDIQWAPLSLSLTAAAGDQAKKAITLSGFHPPGLRRLPARVDPGLQLQGVKRG